MSRHHHSHLLDLHCDLSNEFLIAYPQPSYYYQQKKRRIHRSTNALKTSCSPRPSQCKPKNLLHPYRVSTDDIHTSGRNIKKKIMSIDSPDHEVEFYMVKEPTMSVRSHHLSQMADGDKKTKTFLEEFQQQRFTYDQEHIMKMIHTDLIRPIPCKPTINNRSKQSSVSINLKSFKDSMPHLSSSQISQSTLPLDRTSTWRKLQANITPSHNHHIQKFQHEYLSSLVHHPIMLSPLNKEPETDSSDTPKLMSNITNSFLSSISLPIDSSSNLSDNDNSDTNIPNTSLMNTVHRQEIYHTENKVLTKEKSIRNSLSTSSSKTANISVQNSAKASSLYEIEEFQPILLNDILSSFFPTISNPLASTSSSNNPLVFHSHHHMNDGIDEVRYMLLDHSSDMTEFVIIGPPPPPLLIEEITENDQSKKVQTLFQSIEELCILIRKLLQCELTEQKTTSLQATITSQLAILLTYLAIPNNEKIFSELMAKETIERMKLTDFPEKSLLSTVGTQTDIEWTGQLNDQSSKMLVGSSNCHNEPVQDIVELNVQKSSSSFEIKEKKIIDMPSSSQKATSLTESMSTSVTLHLPGRRPIHALSDTFIYHNRHHEQRSSSYHQFISLSETTIHSLIQRYHHRRRSTKPETEHLLKRIGQQFQHYIELESSNTCLEASTEFTPDFLVIKLNNSKYDDDDQTEQFGIDTEKQDYQTDTISLIINEKEDKVDTLTFNSIEEDDIPKSSIAETDSLVLNNTTSLPLDSSAFDHLNNQEQFCQLLEPLLTTHQWRVPVLLRKTTSDDLLFDKQTAKIDFKHLKIRSNTNNGMNIIGQRVRIKSNSSSQASTPTIKSHLGQKLSMLNHNNNSNDHAYSTESLESRTSMADARSMSTSIDSLCSLNSDTLDKCIILPKKLRMMIDYSKSDELLSRSSSSNIHQNPDYLVQPSSFSTIKVSRLSEVTDRFDSNIELAQSLLDMLDSLNHNNNNSSIENIDLLHMYIRQFLIDFDARIRLDRKRRKRSTKKREKVVY